MAALTLRESTGHHNLAVALSDGIWSVGSCEADFHHWKGMWWIARCQVRAKDRNAGHGTRLMRWMVDQVDATAAPAYLIPNPYDETIDLDRLIAFYERFGFVRTNTPDGDIWVRAAKAA